MTPVAGGLAVTTEPTSGAGVPDRVEKRHWLPVIGVAALVGGALVVVALIVGPALADPAFGAIDDHQIPHIRQQVTVDGLPAVLGRYVNESGARFRPMYWAAYFTEVTVWGKNPTGWYVDRAILVVLSLGLSVWAFRAFVPLRWAILGTLVAFAGTQVEPWYRLGPQEAWAVPLTLAALGLVARDRSGWGIGLAIAAALSKEVFVVSSVAITVFAWYRGARVPAAVGLITLAFIAAAIVFVTVTRPDPYVQSRFGALFAEPRYLWPWLIGLGLAVAVATSWTARRVPLAANVVALILIPVIAFGLLGASRSATEWAAASSAFAARVDAARAAVRSGRTLVVEPRDAYELVFAIRRFVPEGQALLMAPAVQPASDGRLQSQLDAALAELSVRGGHGFTAWQAPGPCVEFPIGRPPAGLCDVAVP